MGAFRNQDYLDWVRQQQCCVSGRVAEVAHHVRKGDKGAGLALKPSDYRVIPLTNFYHTVSDFSVHRMGEISFYCHFGLEIETIQVDLLLRYLLERYQLEFSFHASLSLGQKIELLEETIELQRLDQGMEQQQRQERNRQIAALQRERRQQLKELNLDKHHQNLEQARLYQKELRQRQKDQVNQSVEQQQFKSKQKKLARQWRQKRYQELKTRLDDLR